MIDTFEHPIVTLDRNNEDAFSEADVTSDAHDSSVTILFDQDKYLAMDTDSARSLIYLLTVAINEVEDKQREMGV